MGTSKITVNAEWDAEAKVWVATSDDVPGLVTEAGTVEALAEKLSVIILELLEANGKLLGNSVREVPINLVAHREQVISLRDQMSDYSPDVKRVLRANGCYLHRQGKGDHEIWYSSETSVKWAPQTRNHCLLQLIDKLSSSSDE